MINRRQAMVLGGAALAAPAATWAQDRTVRIIVGFPPGGSVDVVARLLADKMRVSLQQSVIVDNKPGAGGRLALGELKRSAPELAKLAFCGLAFIHASTALRSPAGAAGPAVMAKSKVLAWAMGVKSRTVS